jgi:hypothetical protein
MSRALLAVPIATAMAVSGCGGQDAATPAEQLASAQSTALVRGASATTQQMEKFHYEGSVEGPPCPSGVKLVETYTEDDIVITFFDKTGNPTSVQVHINFEGVVTNPVTGQSVKDPAHATRFIDLVKDTRTVVGLIYSVTVPGVGVVFHDVGRLVHAPDGSITFEAGPHDVLSAGDDNALFCAALGA